MIKEITAVNAYSENENFSFKIELPRMCPHCGKSAIFPIKNAYAFRKDEFDEKGNASITYFCPACEHFFIEEYEGNLISYSTLVLKDTIPNKSLTIEKTFSEEIKTLSSNFVNIYNQSFKAEQLGMKDICGMGYRKSLEFLVKDYAISECQNDIDNIKQITLTECIKKYFANNERLLKLAQASAWLGNDETHYVRKHDEYGIDDLKEFINVMIKYIESELIYKKAEKLLEK